MRLIFLCTFNLTSFALSLVLSILQNQTLYKNVKRIFESFFKSYQTHLQLQIQKKKKIQCWQNFSRYINILLLFI